MLNTPVGFCRNFLTGRSGNVSRGLLALVLICWLSICASECGVKVSAEQSSWFLFTSFHESAANTSAASSKNASPAKWKKFQFSAQNEHQTTQKNSTKKRKSHTNSTHYLESWLQHDEKQLKMKQICENQTKWSESCQGLRCESWLVFQDFEFGTLQSLLLPEMFFWPSQ